MDFKILSMTQMIHPSKNRQCRKAHNNSLRQAMCTESRAVKPTLKNKSKKPTSRTKPTMQKFHPLSGARGLKTLVLSNPRISPVRLMTKTPIFH